MFNVTITLRFSGVAAESVSAAIAKVKSWLPWVLITLAEQRTGARVTVEVVGC